MRRLLAALGASASALVLGLSLAGPAHADDRGASPKDDKGAAAVGLRTATAEGGDRRGKYEYEIPPRGRIVDYVAVSNLRYEPITVRLFAKDATTTTASPYAVQTSDAQPADVGAWTSLRRTRLTLPPRSETVVPFQVGVPANATPGDHVGAIVVSLLAREAKPSGGTIVVDHRVSLRLLLRVPGELTPELTVTDLKATWHGPGTVLGRGSTVVTYTVHNTGNLRLSASGDLEIARALGLPSVTAHAEQIEEIQPGGEVTVRQEIPGVLGTGPMTAHVSLHPRPVDPSLEATDVKTVHESGAFQAWPWLLVSGVLGLLLLLIGGGWFGRRRRAARRAATSPTGGNHRSDARPDSRPDPRPDTSPETGDVLVRWAARALLVGVAVLATAWAAPPAIADDVDVWQGKVSLRKGTDNTPFDMITTGGCPLPGTNVVGFAYGKGFPREGGAVVGNGDAGVEARGPFTMPLAGSMQQLMAEQPNPATLGGTYRIELRCVTPDLQQTTGRYVFAIEFTDPHHWRALPPVTRAQGPNTTGEDKPDGAHDPKGGNGAGSSAGETGGSTGSGGSASPEQLQAAEDRAKQLTGVEDTAGAAGSSRPSWPLIGGGAVVLVATAGYLVTRRTRA